MPNYNNRWRCTNFTDFPQQTGVDIKIIPATLSTLAVCDFVTTTTSSHIWLTSYQTIARGVAWFKLMCRPNHRTSIVRWVSVASEVLGGSGGMLPPGNFWIFRCSFLHSSVFQDVNFYIILSYFCKKYMQISLKFTLACLHLIPGNILFGVRDLGERDPIIYCAKWRNGNSFEILYLRNTKFC